MDAEFAEILGVEVSPAARGPSPATVSAPSVAGGELALGAFEGADRVNSSIANFIPTMGSADADIIPSKPLADGRAQHLLNNDAYVQGGQTLHKDSIVGSQFILNSRPQSRVIFGSSDPVWEGEFQEEVEEIFDLAAESPAHYFDASRMNTLTGLVRLAVSIYCAAGEAVATAEWVPGRPFRTAVQMIDVARLSTPETLPHSLDPEIRGGIKKDNYGAPVSYFFRRVHPNDFHYTFRQSLEFAKWTEVPARLKWGRQQVIHIIEQSRPDQTRGIADLTAALKEIHITHKFRDITLQNAVTQSLYAAAITSELPSETVFAQLGGGSMTPEQVAKAIESYAIGFYNTIDQFAGSAKNLHVDGVRIPHLMPGTKLDMIAPTKGGPLGGEFEQSLLRYIAATLGVSYEQLSRDYTQTSYASARAAMADTWRFMQARKKAVADKFATIIFRLWLEEMVHANQLSTFPASKAALLYTGGVQNLKFDALSRCDWIGASRGQIDELKETQAAVLRINNGLSTLEDEIARLGGDWRKKMRQLKREKDLKEELGLDFNPEASANMMNAANGTADDADQKGTTK